MANEPVNPENLLEADISSIALNERFGSLKFDNASKKLTKIQEYLKEAKDLGFQDLLLEEQKNRIISYHSRLLEQLKWLESFDLATNNSPKTEHDSFEQRIDGFYNDVYQHLVMSFLPFLRDERRRGNPKERKFDEEVRKASQLRSDLEKELQSVRADIEQIKQTKPEVSAAKGERGAARMAVHFIDEAARYEAAAYWWRYGVAAGYAIVLCVVGWFAWEYINEIQASTQQVPLDATLWFSVGTAKLVFALALWYGLQFIVRNYNVNAHLAAVNRHRAAVANTSEDFLAANPTAAGEMLRNATEAMFRHVAIGFISKTDNSSANPATEIINTVTGSKNNA